MHALLEPMSALSLSAHCKASQRLCCRRPCEELTSRRELVSPTTASRLRPLPDRGFSCLLASSLTLHEPHRQTSGGGHVCDSRLADNSEPLSDIARPELSGDGCKKTSRDPSFRATDAPSGTLLQTQGRSYHCLCGSAAASALCGSRSGRALHAPHSRHTPTAPARASRATLPRTRCLSGGAP